MWSKVIGRGKTLRLTDLEGKANVGMLMYNAHERSERYNMPDTLKGSTSLPARALLPALGHGAPLRFDHWRYRGWHDAVCGCSDAALVEKKYGVKTFQEARNDYHRDGQNSFLIELAKVGPR